MSKSYSIPVRYHAVEDQGGGSMALKQVHLLLTYKCIYECDHCFVWSTPGADATMSWKQLQMIIEQAAEIPSVDWIYFEGGEPFLFYPLLVKGVQLAKQKGLKVGIVSNAYWATDEDDPSFWLDPFKGKVADLSLSQDDYHGSGEAARKAERARGGAERMRIPAQVLKLKRIECYAPGRVEDGEGGDLCFRGRAAVNLAPKARKKAWKRMTTCPEDPPHIERVHVDPYGNVQFCQGMTLGNLWQRSLKEIMDDLVPEKHPIIGPLMRGGPAQLAQEAGITPRRRYADPCHLCYDVRCSLRAKGRMKGILGPGQVYGEENAQ